VKALVTGGGGFLGKAIAQQLVARGDTVVSIARGAYPELKALGIDHRRGDVSNLDAVMAAAKGCDVVFHVAAKAGVWGTAAEYESANVKGTEVVLEACRKLGIRKLVYTSSPSVVHGGDAIEGANESLPYPAHYEAHYPRTKAEAEQKVLAANGPELSTVALRPHLIWGPGDNQLTPRIVARAKAGKLRLVGDGKCLVDTVYIDNAAEAHLNACDRLAPGAACAGKAYFITNGEPVPMVEIINGIVGAAGLPPVTRSVSPGVAWFAGAVLEGAYRITGQKNEPMMTRFLARQLSTAHWFDISGAKRDLGYQPRISLQEGLQRLRASFT